MPNTEDVPRTIYLAEAGPKYESAYYREVFYSRKLAEKNLENLEPEESYIDEYDWSNITEMEVRDEQ